ncbi:MAG: ABC transporter substrate-binding protein [Acidobacteria bacterium]|nr:ABC transporter substrate-binding protein [Acidobacteriota bacterium]
MRRLWLGLFLIAATSSVLLISDWSQRKAAGGDLPHVAIFQHASQGILDEGVRGMIDALAEQGFIDQKTIRLRKFNAENDVATANAIAKELTSGQFDLVLTATTISLQTLANANRSGVVSHIFGLVSDPAGAGVGISRTDPLDHPKHLAGIGTMQPVRETFQLARRMYPGLKTVGVAWNAAESNSRANVMLAREVCKELGIGLLEATIENSSGVFEASGSLISRGAEALWVGGDVAVIVAIDSVVTAAKHGRVPVFTSVPGNVERGAIFDVGANYYQVGRLTGALAAQVLQGTDPAAIPIRNIVPEKLLLNKTALIGLKSSWQIPEDVLESADAITDETGTHTRAPAQAGTTPVRKANLQLIELNNIVDVEETEQGVLQGLKEANLVEGRDYEMKIRNAQGDMATVNSLVDAALAEDPDMLITMSTPVLQAAMQRAQGKVPIVFTYVASAIMAGAGTTNEVHLPNVTGVTMIAAYEEMLRIVRRCLPGVRRVGTLFVPSEVNMTFNRQELESAAKTAGIEVVALGVATSSEVPDTALALIGRRVDALCQIPGNLTAASFGGIARAAHRARIPVFAFQMEQAKEGASVVLSRDYFDVGREAAAIAARILRGENPASIPFLSISKTKLVINVKAAREVGLAIPPELISKAVQVIRE